jgi:Pregnancy-associated plasma protein-A/Secretion system C-terminal sorting domain
MPLMAQKNCATQDYLQLQLQQDPSLLVKYQRADAITSNHLHKEILSGATGGSNGQLPIIKIPVVVHVVYNTSDQNISEAQIRSQIEVMNKEFRLQHADTNKIPSVFRSLAADSYIEFALATVTPKGYATNGIVRKKTDRYMYGMDDKIKFSSTGGDEAWDSDKYLNIWVGNLVSGVIGYSSVFGGPKEKDGIVVLYSAFGNTGKLSGTYTKGRTVIHELGHWMGLRHIWGDITCGNDGIDDTPTQKAATRGCPSGVLASCNNEATGAMYNNYMDLTNDECMNMFTIGQMQKMRASFASDGPHAALSHSNAASAIPLPEPATPVANPEVSPLIKLYPNPAQSNITIDISSQENLVGQNLTIHNQLGQQVFSVRLIQLQTRVNLQQLKEGIYFVRIGQQTKPYKLLKTGSVINP